jgi:hypothetical protein
MIGVWGFKIAHDGNFGIVGFLVESCRSVVEMLMLSAVDKSV